MVAVCVRFCLQAFGCFKLLCVVFLEGVVYGPVEVVERQAVDFATRVGSGGAQDLVRAASRAVPQSADASVFAADPRNAQPADDGKPFFLHAEWADDSVYERARRLAALTGESRPVRALRGVLRRFWQGPSRTIAHKDCEAFDEPPIHRKCWEARRCVCCEESKQLVRLNKNLLSVTRGLYRPGALRSKIEAGFIVCCFLGLPVGPDGGEGDGAEGDSDVLYVFFHVGNHGWNQFEPTYVPMKAVDFSVDLSEDRKIIQRNVDLEARLICIDMWSACERFDLSRRWLLAHFELVAGDSVVGALEPRLQRGTPRISNVLLGHARTLVFRCGAFRATRGRSGPVPLHRGALTSQRLGAARNR